LYFFSSCRTIPIQKYFPLEKNSQIVYLKRVDSINFEILDTLICREVSAKQLKNIRPDKLNLSMVDRENSAIIGTRNLYFFEKPTIDSADKAWMHDKSFAESLYCFFKGEMYVSFGWDKAMSYDTELDLLFPKRLKKAIYYKHKNGDYCKAFQYLGKENIVLNGKTHRNCIRIDIFETFGITKKIATVWLAKNIGLMKWTKFNERVAFIKP
jgi:hypothetical protein